MNKWAFKIYNKDYKIVNCFIDSQNKTHFMDVSRGSATSTSLVKKFVTPFGSPL